MTQAPLFVPTHADLRLKLRLTGIEIGTDAEAIIDEALLAARLRFITRLTLGRVTSLLATAYTATPTTEAQYLRLLAAVTEVKIVRLELLDSLPSAFMDAAGNLQKRWNEEAPFRETGVSMLEAIRERLEAEIEEAMELLAGEDLAGEDSSIQTWDGAPDIETPSIGDSLRSDWWSANPNLFQDSEW